MKYDEIPTGYIYSYKNLCANCGNRHEVLTRKDNFPEYDTEIYILCECGEYTEFILPVN